MKKILKDIMFTIIGAVIILMSLGATIILMKLSIEVFSVALFIAMSYMLGQLIRPIKVSDLDKENKN